MGLLAALNSFNASHPWSHNVAFAWFVLGQARAVRRRGGTTAVDVGCGTGHMVQRLTAVLPSVIGIEPDAETAAIAAHRLRDSKSARIDQQSFGDESHQKYDLILFVASLHHMPLRATLRQARSALQPGGRIVIVGLAKETSHDTVRSLISLALNPIVGFVLHPTRATKPPAHMRAPTAQATETFDEIRTIANEVLPGIRMRRGLFWRYTASWVAPT
ncbi:class I SAM-dependent methyltransferase [Ruania halotolerans]|uniref:class I SAM-dependent methyltransferase n=1 Tax=Ruania halotolerans TaxID=2897773 RepID=UPI001E2AC849|nr:class I SAM-dependent methyltransferase [Ruania halotolerans]UFU06102.1 class I SAM-dependent methyltransferase [Ruania halotolerans]